MKNELVEGLGMSESEITFAFIAGTLHLYGVNADGSMYTSDYIANIGYWYTADGNVIGWNWDVSKCFAEFDPYAIAFNLGEMPSQVEVGAEYFISVAFVSESGKSAKLTFNLTFTEKPNLVLSDDETSRSKEAGVYNVTLSRQFSKDKLLIFCTPFNIYEGEFVTYGITDVKRLIGLIHDGENVDHQFGYASDGDKTIRVGIPYIIKVSEDMAGISKESFIIQPSDCQITVTDGTYICTMYGNATKTTLPLGAYYICNNSFYYTITSTNTFKGFRSHFTLEGGAKNAKNVSLSFSDNGGITEILHLMSDGTLVEGSTDIYSVSGQLVCRPSNISNPTEGLKKGIYIVNGKKLIIK